MHLFFYGLFMDIEILHKKGIYPTNPRKAYLDHYALKIGERASLIPSPGERSYGLLMTMGKNDAEKLYSHPSVRDYIPEEVDTVTDSGEVVKAFCYNLPEKALAGSNKSYAMALCELIKQLHFPLEYQNKIKRIALLNQDQ